MRSVVLCIAAVTIGCSALGPADEPGVSTDGVGQELGAAAARPATLVLPGDNYYPESITASLGGALYVSSITTGEIVRFATPSSPAAAFVPAGVNVGTAGVAFDDVRQVLWACAVDLTFSTPTALRAFSARDGALVASYTVPDGGVCGDITLARGDVYITDTLLGLLFKLTTPGPRNATGGRFALWSADPAFRGAGFLQINGIAFDGAHTLYTTNYSTGELIAVAIRNDGTAGAARVIQMPRALTTPDGIRVVVPFTGSLFVTENTGALSRVDATGGTAAITVLGTFDQPTSVIRVGHDLWVAEGQDLRLQGVDPTPVHLPFVVRRLSL
jgi:hypothetical protein